LVLEEKRVLKHSKNMANLKPLVSLRLKS